MDARFDLLDEGTLASLDETFRRDGIAVLANVIPPAVLDKIGEHTSSAPAPAPAPPP